MSKEPNGCWAIIGGIVAIALILGGGPVITGLWLSWVVYWFHFFGGTFQ